MSEKIFIELTDIILPPKREKFDDVYIAYVLIDIDLHKIIWSTQSLANCWECTLDLLNNMSIDHAF